MIDFICFILAYGALVFTFTHTLYIIVQVVGEKIMTKDDTNTDGYYDENLGDSGEDFDLSFLDEDDEPKKD